MNNHSKLKLLLGFVILYTLIVFGWWGYSLLKFNEDLYLSKSNELLLETEIEKRNLMDLALFGEFKEGGVEVSCLSQGAVVNIEAVRSYMIKEYSGKYDFELVKDHNNILEDCIQLSPSRSQLEKLENIRNSKKRAYISEVIFFVLFLMVGFYWLYNRLQTIVHSNMQQSNFLLAITHELKTPLATVLLSLDTIRRKIAKEDYKIEKYVKMGSGGVDRFQVLLDDILLTTRLEGKSYKYNFSKLDVAKVLMESVEVFKTITALDSEISMNFKTNAFAMIDEKTFRIVISNLLSNAVKYSQNNVKIDISCGINGNYTEIVVSDEGKGIPNSEKKNIFKRFYRIGNEDTREASGTGLGLNIVKKIINHHKGIIKVTDNSPKGTNFIIKLKNYG